MEAAKLGVKYIMAHVYNFKDIYEFLRKITFQKIENYQELCINLSGDLERLTIR